MTFKTEQEAIGWVKYNLPWTVINSKGKPVFPFISLKVFDEIANHLGKELFKMEQQPAIKAVTDGVMDAVSTEVREPKIVRDINKDITRHLLAWAQKWGYPVEWGRLKKESISFEHIHRIMVAFELKRAIKENN